MFPVEIRIQDGAEGALTGRMTTMREWLDHQRIEPSSFRYSLTGSGIIFLVNFVIATEAVAFATEFSGRILGEESTEIPLASAERQTGGVAIAVDDVLSVGEVDRQTMVS